MIDIDTFIENGEWEQAYSMENDFDDIYEYIEFSARNALSYAGVTLVNLTGEISITLDNDQSIKKMNAQWRNKDTSTNVLSFQNFQFDTPGRLNKLNEDVPFIALGDIVLSLETIQKEAQCENKTFNHHLSHLVIHGVLHLLGFDHVNDQDAEIMEKMETKILAQMGIANPYELSHETSHETSPES